VQTIVRLVGSQLAASTTTASSSDGGGPTRCAIGEAPMCGGGPAQASLRREGQLQRLGRAGGRERAGRLRAAAAAALTQP
jgi:hypothetical protein